MALTISQVNQGFLALFGRPATGAEATKFASQADVASLATALQADPLYTSELTASFPKIKMVDLNAATDDAFVESLYQAFIGRASDAEGKTFWLGVKAAGATREEVLAQFEAVLKEQAKEGTADGIAYENIMSENTSLVSAWVETLYQNLAARASDAEGLNYWTTQAIQNGGAAVVAAFAASLAAQGNTTEDGQNFAQKQGVADAFTNAFKDFNNLITANEKAEALKNIHTMMDGVNKDSQLDQYTEEVIKFVDEYQNFKSIQFTKADDDQLGVDPETGEPNLTSAANFTGTYNITDPTKGTIQGSDTATGSEKYLTDTLTVSVTGYDKTTNNEFNIGELPATTSVERLVINNGAAAVTDGNNGRGNISGDFEYINVKGTGAFRISADTSAEKGFKDIVLNSGTTKENEAGNYFGTTDTVQSIKTGAGDDELNLSLVTKSISTGAGKDKVYGNNGLVVDEGATVDLGAGDDEFVGTLGIKSSLAGGAGDDKLTVVYADYTPNAKGAPIATVEIDGGTGTDTLDLSQGVTGAAKTKIIDLQGIKTIKGIEKLIVGDGTTLYASAISGQKIELSGTKMVLNAAGATNVDVSKFTNATNQNVEINITNVKSGNINLEANDKNTNNIKEAIVLTNDAKGVTIKNFAGKDDTISIKGATADNNELFAYKDATNKEITNFKAALVKDHFYYAETTAAISLNTFKDINVAGLAAGDAIYVIAHDKDAKNNPSSVAKVYKIVVGTTDATKVSSVTQMATINVANREVISNTSVVDAPEDPTPAPVKEAGLVMKYATPAGDTLDLAAAAQTYADAYDFTGAEKLIVNTVSGGNLDVSGDSSLSVKTVDAFITGGDGTVANKLGDGVAKVNVYLGGSEKADGTITANSVALDFDTNNKANNAIASGADTLVAYTTGEIKLKDVTAFDTNLKLDLGQVKANVVIVSGAATTDLTTLITGEDANDKVSVEAVVGTTLVKGTKAQDTITLNATPGAKATIDLGAADAAADTVVYQANAIANLKGDTITSFGTEDKIDLSDLTLGANLTGDTATADGEATFATGKVYAIDFSATKAADEVAFTDLFNANGAFSTVVTGNEKGLIVAKGNDNKYAVWAVKNGADVTVTTGEVALVAIVDGNFTSDNYLGA